MKAIFLIAGLLAMAVPAASRAAGPVTGANDYPTAARADYVFACMNVNGGTQEALRRCSCSIDVIAAALPYDQYELADTILRMRQMTGGGYLKQEFQVKNSNTIVQALREAQAEAEVRCF